MSRDINRRGALGGIFAAIFGGPDAAKAAMQEAANMKAQVLQAATLAGKIRGAGAEIEKASMVDPIETAKHMAEIEQRLTGAANGELSDWQKRDIEEMLRGSWSNAKHNIKALKSVSKANKERMYKELAVQKRKETWLREAKRELSDFLANKARRFFGYTGYGAKDAQALPSNAARPDESW